MEFAQYSGQGRRRLTAHDDDRDHRQQDKIDAFERMVRPHGLIEMARTGEIAIARARSRKLIPGLDTAEASLARLAERADSHRRLLSVTVLWTSTTPRRRYSPPGGPAIAGSGWEQPERDGFALAGLGAAAELVSRGQDRFTTLPSRRASFSSTAWPTSPATCRGPPGRCCWGASRSTPRGARAPLVLAASRAHVLPEISLCRRGGRTLLDRQHDLGR